jgi:sarcosine oxidase subunit beta
VISASGASVIIVGGGVTGLSAGWWLARTGVDVLVLEKSVVGWEASGRNGGGSAAFHSPLFDEAERLWPQLHELLGYPTEFVPGRLKIAMTERQLAYFAETIANARHRGYTADELDSTQVCEFVPLASVDCAGGVFYRAGGHMNPQRTVQGYAWALQDLGGRIRQHAAVTGIEIANGKAVEVRTGRDHYGCDALVIAVGPQTNAIAAMVGVEVPVATARVEMIVTEPLPLMPFTNVDGNGLYGRQTLRGNLAYGGGPHEWLPDDAGSALQKHSSPLLRSIALRVQQLLPKARHARVIRSWAGFVENTPDGRPVIDRIPSIDNGVVATMSSVGFGLSPASGRAIQELVCNGACSFADLSSLHLSRFRAIGPDWRAKRGWEPAIVDAATASSSAQRLS